MLKLDWINKGFAPWGNQRMRWLSQCAIVALVLYASAAFSQGQTPRLALVIGNSNYESQYVPQLTRLPSAVNDADDVSASLRRAGWEVITVKNAGSEAMFNALKEFGRRIQERPQTVPLFYFSGHGVQLEQRNTSAENVLIPIDLREASDADIERRGLPLRRIISIMSASRAEPKIIVLDACRTPGFGKSAGAKGLARVDEEVGFYMEFASAPGRPAFDDYSRGERNSRFTKHWLSHLRQTDLRFDDVFKRTRRTLLDDPSNSDKQQSSTVVQLTEITPFYFSVNASESAAARPLAPVTSQQAPQAPSAPAVAPTPPPPSPPRLADLQTFKDCPDCPEMVVIPAGSFMMGSPASEKGRFDNEGPQRRINVERFAIGKYEVTKGQFAQFVSDTGYQTDAEKKFEGCSRVQYFDGKWSVGDSGITNWRSPGFTQSDQHPVVCVNENDARAYIAWLNNRSNVKGQYRLPSEAQWEYAARAGTTTRYYWGDDADDMMRCQYANTADEANFVNQRQWKSGAKCGDGYRFTTPIGLFHANAWGLHDVSGNAKELVQDCLSFKYDERQPRDGSANLVGECGWKMRRGGSWVDGQTAARSATRDKGANVFIRNYEGFRLSRTAP